MKLIEISPMTLGRILQAHRRFAPTTGAWVHFDIFAWNARTRPGWSSGAEAQVIRALYRLLKARYS